MSVTSLAYCFFGRTIRVETDEPNVARALDGVYARQLLQPAPRDADLVARIWGAGGSRIEVAGRTIRVPEPDQLPHYAHLVLINAAAALLADAVVLHAAAVTRGGRAAVILGHSGQGKTTLTVELVRRGCGFLSDDFAVLGPDGVVQPFPRRVNLTDASIALLGLRMRHDRVRLAGIRGVSKSMVDIEDLFPGSLADAAPLVSLAILGPPVEVAQRAAVIPGAVDSGVVWRIEVDRVAPGLERALAGEAGIVSVRRVGADGRGLEIETAPGARLVSALDDICARLDVAVLFAQRAAPAAGAADESADVRTSHSGDPRVSTIESAAVLPEILSYALSLSGARFFGQSREREILRAMAILRAAVDTGVRLVRVEPGALAPTADAIEALL